MLPFFALLFFPLYNYVLNLLNCSSDEHFEIFLISFPWMNQLVFLFSYVYAAAAAAKSLQSCPTPCSPIDSSPPGSPISGILQARTLEWVSISFSNACKWKVKVKSLSCVRLLVTPWTATYQAPPSMGFSRQEYWSGVPLPSLFILCWLWKKNYPINKNHKINKVVEGGVYFYNKNLRHLIFIKHNLPEMVHSN